MRSISTTRAFRGLAAAGAIALFLNTATAVSQESATPAWLDVTVVRVKPTERAAFEDLISDLTAARQAAGQPATQVFQVVVGDTSEYHLVRAVGSISATESLPAPLPDAAWVAWQARVRQTVEFAPRNFYAATFPQHNVQAPAGSPPATLLMLRKVTVDQGSQADYEAWVADQYMPAFRQANAGGHTMSHSIYGDSILNYYHAYALSGWEDIEGPDPLLEVLGQQRYDRVFGAIDDIVVEHEMVVALVRTDLMAQ